MVVIRSASAADAAQIAAVMQASWRAAYEDIIAPEVIGRVTASDGGARIRQSFRTRPWQKTFVAVEAPASQPAARRKRDAADGIVGYAFFGPEQDVLGAPWPHPLSPEGEQGQVAELYALYVHPAWWSTGTGRALMDRVLDTVTVAGYLSVRLWVLRDNFRARRFYERAGFAPDGASHTLNGLGGVTEVRYRRVLPAGPGRDVS
ncbi:MAG: GNAT family N-acetyltransferase [Streptosporangiaceae bacterium]